MIVLNYQSIFARRYVDELAIPTFLYGAAATSPDRSLLSDLKGQYEGFRQRLKMVYALSDLGPQEWNETVARFGAVVIGARNILVAYNVNVDEKDAHVAKFGF